MVNNKGYLRTLEALISVIALLALLLFIIPREVPEKETPDIIKSSHNYFLNTVVYSEKHRNCILNAPLAIDKCNRIKCEYCGQISSSIECDDLIDNLLYTANAPGLETKCIICETNPLDRSCLLPGADTLPETDIYVDSALLNNERLVRLFSYTK